MSILRSLTSWIFTILVWIFIAALTTFFLFVILLFKPFEKNQSLSYRIPNLWGLIISKISPAWHIELQGLDLIEENEGYVFVVNHRSFADIICVHLLQRHFKWVAKDSLFKIPVIGWIMSLVSYIPLQRDRHGSIKTTYREALEWLRRHISIVIFPEGTRTPGNQLRNFKNGAFKLAIESQKPIVPVVIHGSDQIQRANSRSLSFNMQVNMKILKPIPTAGKKAEDFGELKKEVYDIMQTEYSFLCQDMSTYNASDKEVDSDSEKPLLPPTRIEQ